MDMQTGTASNQQLECGAVGTIVLMLPLMLITMVYVGLDANLAGNAVGDSVLVQTLVPSTVADSEIDFLGGACASNSMACLHLHNLCHHGLFHDPLGHHHCLPLLDCLVTGLSVHRRAAWKYCLVTGFSVHRRATSKYLIQ
ncbi:Uncharacterized protein TCM_030815 [Theobroma cacao]|uniref:Uncharacterized protein n=1 Tax=Theobroma cacao TaxID=3641 RepID=A0A061F6F7_THECC|nr:Uncharacterized protein TCM_030815 [Theobroma cacao]